MIKKLSNTANLKDLKSMAEEKYVDNIKMLPICLLHDNPERFHDLSNLDMLAEDIDRQGLKEPLHVVFNDNGNYIIINGHRRKYAVQSLIKGGKRSTDKLPCFIINKQAKTLLDFIVNNVVRRGTSDAEIIKMYSNLKKIFIYFKEDGVKISGRMRDNIAVCLNVSSAQIGKIEYIYRHAIDEIKLAVESDKMSISTANMVSRLTHEQQKELIKNKSLEKITHKEAKETFDNLRKSYK
ncbi:MAG: ParB/RepB/Spo0J family partition protein [Bacteroides sp.]|nr:ParB/RepB/Spo0J family partition protein [Bacteroides sp.]